VIPTATSVTGRRRGSAIVIEDYRFGHMPRPIPGRLIRNRSRALALPLSKWTCCCPITRDLGAFAKGGWPTLRAKWQLSQPTPSTAIGAAQACSCCDGSGAGLSPPLARASAEHAERLLTAHSPRRSSGPNSRPIRPRLWLPRTCFRLSRCPGPASRCQSELHEGTGEIPLRGHLAA
jgi:hypothetical protein